MIPQSEFERLWVETEPRIRKIVKAFLDREKRRYRFPGDTQEAANDVVQDTACYLVKRLPGLPFLKPAFLIRVAVDRSRNLVRSAVNRREVSMGLMDEREE